MKDTGLRHVHVNDYSIAFREAGQGDALVLLHGFLCDSRCWRQQLAKLSDHFRVIAWDAPGAGFSTDPPEEFTTDDYARCLAGFLDALSIRHAHIVGLSWGGILAQEFYRLYPERLRSLVLADTYAGWKGSLPESVWRERLEICLRDSTGSSDALILKLLPGMFTGGAPKNVQQELADIMSEFHPGGFRVMSKSSAEADTRDLLPGIRVPVLLVWGEEDERSPLQIADQFHNAIPSAELAVIPGAGHVSNMERPDEFNEHVRRFCIRQQKT